MNTFNLSELNNNSEILNFLNLTSFFKSSNRKGLGITLKNGTILMLKYYLELTELDEIDCYKNLLGTQFNFFKRLKKYTDFSIPASYSIGKKISNTGEIFDYYHVKFKNNFTLKKLFYKLNLLDLSSCSYGFSKEYSKTKIYNKRYIYLKTPKNIQHLITLFNLKLKQKIEDIDHFEIYCKNKDSFKINFILNTNNYKCLLNTLPLTPNDINCIEYTNNFFNNLPVYGGFDKNNNISIYYSLTNK